MRYGRTINRRQILLFRCVVIRSGIRRQSGGGGGQSPPHPRAPATAGADRSVISPTRFGEDDGAFWDPVDDWVFMTACALAFWASLAAAQVNPGDPSSSALGESPGASGAVSFGRAPSGTQAVIPVGPGPSYPRVPRGITHPPEPFGSRPSNLGIEPLSPLPETRLPLTGQFAIGREKSRRAPATG